MNAIVECKPWRGNRSPKKILVMRFQALGDTIITLPYLKSLKQQYPDIVIHFLTRKEVSHVPACVLLFDKVITIGDGRNAKLQFLLTLFKLPWLWFQRYDAVLDLQNHKISKVVRKLIAAAAWTEFDRTSPISAGERTRQTIEALWTWKIALATSFQFKNYKFQIDELLKQHGWKQNHELVVLNPAGYSPSRSWPTNHYIEFAKAWIEYRESTQFVLLLLPAMEAKANAIAQALGNRCINLTGKANQVEAFAVLKKCKFVLSEDSGLMHMAWVQGIPTLALFSSSRKDWSAPQGEWSYCLDSSDLECGPCMLEVCKFGDNRCLIRYTPEFVLDKAKALTSPQSI